MKSIIYLIGIICALWVIYDVWANNKKYKKNTLAKIIWSICSLFFSIITAIVYYFVEKR